VTCRHYFIVDPLLEDTRCQNCGLSVEEVNAARQPILLQGGPWDLDGTEVPDDYKMVKVITDMEGEQHLYYVMRDWNLDRWVGKYQNTRKVACS